MTPITRQPITLPPWALDGVGLTRREAEVLCQVALGQTNTEIGRILGTSLRTVQKHLQHIYAKLGVRTRTAAAILSLRLALWERVATAAPHRRRFRITGSSTGAAC